MFLNTSYKYRFCAEGAAKQGLVYQGGEKIPEKDFN